MDELIARWNQRIAELTKAMSEQNQYMASCASACQMLDAVKYQGQAQQHMATIRGIRSCIADLEAHRG